ncbi:MAG TPA: methionine--tRNA ligase [Burkholderiales bacterium]|nr:methionine--tRNA ligase [Burkholderiales bacterium]
MPRRILVTSALPYANGSIHLGHLVEYIQTDIWVRFQKMRGHEVHYVCADDTHGTPIMLRADQEGITPEQLIARVHGEHTRDFAGFHVAFDNYYTTNSPENRAFCEDIYNSLKAKDLIARRSVEQFYDPVKQMFLPDRYIKGECPNCHSKDQYGDSCEVCGKTYAPTDLIDPYSVVSGAKPERKASEHHFFKLSDERCEKFLRQFTQTGDALQPEAANKMKEWLGEPGDSKLADWDISRDAPYFGFPIPGTSNQKFFYVWLDAPVGYFGSFAHYATRLKTAGKPIDKDAFLRPGGNTEMVHFIGKDILYFHALFWPAMLEFAGYRVPTKVFAHGFLTVDGQKMSKSRGTFITAESYLQQGLNPEWLRYYYAAKLNSTMEDIDLNLEDFVARVNSDLIGKYVNIASRAAGFITREFEGSVRADLDFSPNETSISSDAALLMKLWGSEEELRRAYEEREFGQAVREIMRLTDLVNQYVDHNKPWELAKSPAQKDRLHIVCSAALEAFRVLTVYLKPILPNVAFNTEKFLNIAPLDWAAHKKPLAHLHRIGKYDHLLTRVDPKQIAALVEANKESLQPALQSHSPQRHAQQQEKAVETATAPNHITIDDFNKVELRVARIVAAEHVEGADKLLKLQLDLGNETRQVFAGIKSAYDPAKLVGRLTVMVANLQPRKMRFGESQGMVLAASGDGPGIFLLSPDDGAQPGMRVK